MPAQHNNATQPNSLHLLIQLYRIWSGASERPFSTFTCIFIAEAVSVCVRLLPRLGHFPWLEQLLRAQAWSWNAHSELHMFPLGVTVCSVHCATQRMTQCIMTHIHGTALGVTGYNPTYNTMHWDTYTLCINSCTEQHMSPLCFSVLESNAMHCDVV